MQFKRFLAAVLVLAGIALGQTQAPAPTVPSQAALPFFFPPGFYTTTDPLRQREEYVRWLNSTWNCNQGNPNGMGATIPGSDSISVQTDVVSTDSVTENPAKMKMIFDHYIRVDGKVRYTDMCHQQFITDDQLATVENGLKAIVIDAAQRDYDFYNVIYDKAVTARAQK